MSKVVKAVVVGVVAAAIIVFAAPIAAGLTVAGASIFGASFAITTAAIVAVGASLALAAAGTLFRKAPSLSNALQDRLNSSIIPSAPRKIVFGRTAAGNDIRFVETHGSKKDRNAQIIALASHRLTAIHSWYVENDLTWSGGNVVANQKGIRSFRAVLEGSAANAAAMGSGAYWTASSRFTGCAYLAIDYNLSSEAWPSGIPARTTTEVDGCPVYDPRLDTTTGGSGPHRIADNRTWAFTANGAEIGRNPALCLLTYLIGWRVNGKLMWGMGIPANRINFDSFRVYANVCEERVATLAGPTAQRYTCDGMFSTSDTHNSVISAITAAMGSCKFTDVGGTYCLVGGYDDTLGPKPHLTEDDLVGTPGAPTPYTWVPGGPSRETYNIVRGRFSNPTELYQLADWGDPIESEELPDGIPRTLTLDLGCVSRAETCQRIAKQFLLREAKTPGFFSATFGPRAFACQVGDLIELSVNAQGWNKKLFRVEEQTELEDMFFEMRLREDNPEIYAWDREEKPLPPVIRPAGYDPKTIIRLTGVSVTSESYQGAD